LLEFRMSANLGQPRPKKNFNPDIV
jgi:hypothetical protein